MARPGGLARRADGPYPSRIMIPRFRPPFDPSDALVLAGPSRPGDLARFEEAFAALAGQERAVLFPYGRTGLMALAEALGLAGGEVLCPAYTCVVVAHALVKSGCEPVFVDVGADRCMDLEAAGRAVTPRTRAILATSLFGHPVDDAALTRFSRAHPGVVVIMDCAQGFFAGQGTWRRGAAALFSLGLSKSLSTAGGGIVTTDDPGLAEALRRAAARLRPPTARERLSRRLLFLASLAAFAEAPYALVNLLERKGFLSGLADYYREDLIEVPVSHDAALEGWQGRLGLRQVGRYAALAGARRNLFDLYRRALAGAPGITPPPDDPWASPSHFAVEVPNRAEVMAEAARRGVQLGWVLEYAVPELAAYRGRPGDRGPYPVASRLARTMVNLPMGVSMSRAARAASVFLESLEAAAARGDRGSAS